MRTTWTEEQAENMHDDFLRDCTESVDGTVNIAGLRYDVAHALKRLDPIAYRESFLCWLSDNCMDWDDKAGVYYYESYNEAPY
jgi:hypothetical protein